MARPGGNRWISRLLLLSALGCAASSVLLQVHAMLGLLLAAVTLFDLGLVWLLRSHQPARVAAGISD